MAIVEKKRQNSSGVPGGRILSASSHGFRFLLKLDLSMRLLLLVCLLFLFQPAAVAQTSESLSYAEFLQRVLDHHPRAQRAELLIDQADAALRRAKGAFDPKLEGDLSQKVFDEKNYYRYLDGGIKMPTRLGGLELKAGYEMASGIFQNPEFSTPGAGLLQAGVALPLGQGLLIDPARAAYRQALIGIEAAPNDQQAQLNNLLYEAAYAYWTWAEADSRVRILTEATLVAEQRLIWTRNTVVAGDFPAIDTLKAAIQYQNRRLDLEQSLLELEQARFWLQFYLWNEQGQPWQGPEILSPQEPASVSVLRPLTADSLSRLMLAMDDLHPDLRAIRYDLAFLEVERRMKAEKLKPKLNIEYAFLNEAIFGSGGTTVDPRLFMDNYKWGFQVSFPLFLREARGDLGLTRVKIQDVQWKREEKEQEIQAKLSVYSTQLGALFEQMALSRDNVLSYRALLAAEESKFRAGESSLFEINVWETQLLEAELKLLSLQTKYAQTQASLAWSAGQLAASWNQ